MKSCFPLWSFDGNCNWYFFAASDLAASDFSRRLDESEKRNKRSLCNSFFKKIGMSCFM